MFPVSGAAAPNIGGAERVAAEDLVEQAELELAVAGTAELLVEEDRPQALVLDLVLQALDQRLDLRVLGADRVGEHVLERLDLLAAELLDPVELLLELGFGREVPGHGVSFFSVGPIFGTYRLTRSTRTGQPVICVSFLRAEVPSKQRTTFAPSSPLPGASTSLPSFRRTQETGMNSVDARGQAHGPIGTASMLSCDTTPAVAVRDILSAHTQSLQRFAGRSRWVE